MDIRKLTSGDVDAIVALEKDHAPDPPLYARYDKEALDFIFDNPTTCAAFGIFDNGRLVGWGAYRTQWPAHGNPELGAFEISSIVVDTTYRRQGIGKKLLEYIYSEIKDRIDYKKIYLTVSPKNLGALLLYLNFGFGIYDFKKDVYGPGSDRLYLSRG